MEKYPGDDRRQIYHMWRDYPLGSKITLCLGFFVGMGVSSIAWVAITRLM